MRKHAHINTQSLLGNLSWLDAVMKFVVPIPQVVFSELSPNFQLSILGVMCCLPLPIGNVSFPLPNVTNVTNVQCTELRRSIHANDLEDTPNVKLPHLRCEASPVQGGSLGTGGYVIFINIYIYISSFTQNRKKSNMQFQE